VPKIEQLYNLLCLFSVFGHYVFSSFVKPSDKSLLLFVIVFSLRHQPNEWRSWINYNCTGWYSSV